MDAKADGSHHAAFCQQYDSPHTTERETRPRVARVCSMPSIEQTLSTDSASTHVQKRKRVNLRQIVEQCVSSNPDAPFTLDLVRPFLPNGYSVTESDAKSMVNVYKQLNRGKKVKTTQSLATVMQNLKDDVYIRAKRIARGKWYIASFHRHELTEKYRTWLPYDECVCRIDDFLDQLVGEPQCEREYDMGWRPSDTTP